MGCLFHFNQAAWRKMVDLGIPENEIKSVVAYGVCDLLTVIPIEQLERGMVFVRTKIIDFVSKLSKSAEEKEKFWEYFEW